MKKTLTELVKELPREIKNSGKKLLVTGSLIASLLYTGCETMTASDYAGSGLGTVEQNRELTLIEKAIAHNNSGIILCSKGDLNGAVHEFRRALEINPDFADVHNNLGMVLYGLGDLDGAIYEYRRVLEINPYDVLAHNNLGSFLYKKGDLEGAIYEYRRALEIDPNNAEVRSNLEDSLKEINSR